MNVEGDVGRTGGERGGTWGNVGGGSWLGHVNVLNCVCSVVVSRLSW